MLKIFTYALYLPIAFGFLDENIFQLQSEVSKIFENVDLKSLLNDKLINVAESDSEEKYQRIVGESKNSDQIANVLLSLLSDSNSPERNQRFDEKKNVLDNVAKLSPLLTSEPNSSEKNQSFIEEPDIYDEVDQNSTSQDKHYEDDERAFGFAKHLFNKFSFRFDGIEKESAEDECKRKGGALINDECYKYNSNELNFEEARATCNEDGGELWTPDPDDTFLYYKMALLMPEFTRATKDRLWIGYISGTEEKEISTIDGDDISHSVLAQIDRGLDPEECLVLKFERGGFFTSSKNCENADEEFICEIELRSKMEHEKNMRPFQFLKHIFKGRK